MPKFTYTTEEVPQFELLKPGPYPFEVISYAKGLGSGKTSANEVVTLGVRFFKDRTFQTPVAQWSERISLPLEEVFTKDAKDLQRFFQGTCNMFVKCTNIQATPGQDIELDEATCTGLRGVAMVGWRLRDKNAPVSDENKINVVKSWLTDKEKFPKAVTEKPEGDDEPF